MPNLNPNVNLAAASVIYIGNEVRAVSYGFEYIRHVTALGLGVVAFGLNEASGDFDASSLFGLTARIDSTNPVVTPENSFFSPSVQIVNGADMAAYGIITDKKVLLARFYGIELGSPAIVQVPFTLTVTQGEPGEFHPVYEGADEPYGDLG